MRTSATSLIESAGLLVAETAAHTKLLLSATYVPATGVVHVSVNALLLLGKRSSKKTTFTYSWSADGGKTWSAGVTTGYTSLDVPGLATGTYLFRVFATVAKVPGGADPGGERSPSTDHRSPPAGPARHLTAGRVRATLVDRSTHFDGGSWNVKPNETPTEAVAAAARRDAQLDEKIALLDACHTALDASGLAVLDAVFAPFMRRHYDKVRRRAVRWGVPEDDASDLVQEVFFAFHGRVRDHGVKRSLLTTLHIVARGKLLHAARARRQAPPTVGLPSSGSALPESSVDLARAVDLRTARSFVHELSEEHQVVVEKVILEDKSAGVAAGELGLPEGTVCSRLRAAVELLRARTAPWLPQSQRDAR